LGGILTRRGIKRPKHQPSSYFQFLGAAPYHLASPSRIFGLGDADTAPNDAGSARAANGNHGGGGSCLGGSKASSGRGEERFVGWGWRSYFWTPASVPLLIPRADVCPINRRGGRGRWHRGTYTGARGRANGGDRQEARALSSGRPRWRVGGSGQLTRPGRATGRFHVVARADAVGSRPGPTGQRETARRGVILSSRVN
jgi:hypothetical protein